MSETKDVKVYKKKVNWVFDKGTGIIGVSDDSVKAEVEKQFSFVLLRYKDATSHEETLKIESLFNGKPNGSIFTSFPDLQNNIKSFARFGVIIEASYMRDLCKEIEKVYLQITCQTIDMKNDDRFDSLIEQVKDFVLCDNKYVTKDLCYVPVKDFDHLAEDMGYYSYEIRSLKSTLSEQRYIHTSTGRYTTVKKISGKAERCIAFVCDKVGVVVEDKQVKKEMGEGDEE